MQSSTLKRLLTGLSFLFIFSLSLNAQQGNAENGKKLFNTHCAACHKLDKRFVGPPLKGITKTKEREWLHLWIKDNASLIKSGDKEANAIFEEYNKIPMTPFPQLSETDIDDILAYTDDNPVGGANAAVQVDPALAAKGKGLFQTHCAACHKLEGKLVGPGLGNVSDKRSKEWLHAWIKDNAALRSTGDKDAIAIFEEYNKIPMTAFPQLSEEDIDAILAYTTAGMIKPAETTSTEAAEIPVATTKPLSTAWISYTLVLVLFIILLWLLLYSKNGFLKISAVILVLLVSAYVLFDNLMGVGLDQGYQPIQPIAFSHKIHAGDNKIDCEYCHSSAKNSKTSGIPSVNVCMNCHKSISEYTGKVASAEEKAFYDNEIHKIYDAIGWDPEKAAYIENYQVKPIKWNRIHNLPDFVYYNHSQHVTVAGQKCQTCHGPVEEMDEVYQYSPLTMRWCIDCHKETEVDLKGNDYYAKIHEQLAKERGLEKVTIADLGGKECGKCHY